MLFPSSLAFLAVVASVNAHADTELSQGANGVNANGLAIIPGTPGTGSTKVTEVDTTIFGAKANRDAASTTGCGKTKGGGVVDCATAAAASLATAGGQVPTANSDGTVDLVFHQVNQDGAGPLAAMVSTDMGATWEAATTTCAGTAGSATGVCLVALANPIAGFGGSAPFQMANAEAPAAASVPAAAASAPAAAPVAKRQVPPELAALLTSEGVDPADFQIKAFLHKRQFAKVRREGRLSSSEDEDVE
ncbi:hypothetical protein RQP46_004152 [Phenoliferia psychrophenolica]